MNKRTAIIRTSVVGLILIWSGLALAQSTVIEPVEAKVMAQKAKGSASERHASATGQKKTVSGEPKQAMSHRGEPGKGDLDASAKGQGGKQAAVKTSQQKAQKGEALGGAKQEKAAKGDLQGKASQQKAQKGEALGGAKQEKAAKGESAKQMQKGSGAALREATRTSDRMRIRENKRDHVSAGERGSGAGSGERRQSEAAEHRQERRGGASASGGAGKAGGSGNGAKAGQN